MLAQWLALSGIIARGRGDSDSARRYCSEALSSLPQKRYGQRLMCLSTLANLSIAEGDLWRARALNREALELAQRVANPLFEALAHYDRARVLQARGETLRSMDEVRQGLQRLNGLSSQRLYAVRARLTLYEGYLLVQCLQPEAGRARLNAGLAEARACRDISVLIGHCVIAGLEGREGRFAEAFAELAEAERLMHIWDVPPVYYLAMITLVKCELWMAQGRIDLADAWLLRLAQTYSGEEAAAAPECLPQMPQHIELLRAVLDNIQGRTGQSAERLQQLEQYAANIGAGLLAVNAVSQHLLLVLGTSDQRQAPALLTRCMQAASGGVVLPFLGLIRQHPDWLREQLLARPACRLVEYLLKQLPVSASAKELPLPVELTPCHVTDYLSNRELGVLQLIAQGCSNQEISERLFISLHTVKTHASHINSKLGVERRTQAVARAQELGLLG
jgi:LuxR family maltose regulon positive regulatory protein